jgi:lysyl oxidase
MRLALAAIVAFASIVGIALAAGAQDPSDAPEYLPDLRQRVPSELSAKYRRRAGRTRVALGFRSVVDNVGAGPLVVRGQRLPNAGTMTADQVVAHRDGSTTVNPAVGTLRYTRLPDHAHWHFLRFDRYTLRSARSGRLVRRDHKTGFCLADGAHIRGFRKHVPARVLDVGYDDNDCARRRPLARRLTEGISVGWLDDYDPYLEGQDIDITGLRAGRYELAHHVNSTRRLRESNYENNAASVLIRLRWEGGVPKITVLRRCRLKLSCR